MTAVAEHLQSATTTVTERAHTIDAALLAAVGDPRALAVAQWLLDFADAQCAALPAGSTDGGWACGLRWLARFQLAHKFPALTRPLISGADAARATITAPREWSVVHGQLVEWQPGAGPRPVVAADALPAELAERLAHAHNAALRPLVD